MNQAIEKLVLASGNAGKLKELSRLLEPLHIQVAVQSDFNVDPVDETGLTFVENAILKAREASRASGLPALGDDSGLAVDALKGRPGIFSSRFAGDQADDEANNALLLEKLQGLPSNRRGAAFHCCLVLLRHPEDPAPLIATGRWEGRILESPRGEGGFGYDPLFYDETRGVGAAELALTEKNRISHRGQALQKLIEKLENG